MPLLDALQLPTYSRYFKDILANKYEIATLGVDHVKMSEECSDVREATPTVGAYGYVFGVGR
jgi:hypothetical protein